MCGYEDSTYTQGIHINMGGTIANNYSLVVTKCQLIRTSLNAT